MQKYRSIPLFTLILMVIWVSFAQTTPDTLISIQLQSGDHTGSFEVSQQDSSCLYGTSNGDDWRTLYSTDAALKDDEVSTVLLLIPNTTEAESGSSNFFLSVGFGTYDSPSYFEYILDPQNSSGSGNITVQKDGSHATLSITGQTKAGEHLSATITCNNVLEVSGKPKALSELGELRFAPDNASATGAFSLSIGSKTYQGQTASEATCIPNAFGEGDSTFAYGYYVDNYDSFDIYIRDLEAAKQGTSDFGFSINTFYLVYRPGEGSGSLKTTQTDNKLTITVDATSPEGIPVTATISCLIE